MQELEDQLMDGIIYAFHQQTTDENEYITVGVNGYTMDAGKALEILRIDRGLEAEQRERVKAFKAGRDAKKVAERIEAVRSAAVEDRNLRVLLFRRNYTAPVVGFHTVGFKPRLRTRAETEGD